MITKHVSVNLMSFRYFVVYFNTYAMKKKKKFTSGKKVSHTRIWIFLHIETFEKTSFRRFHFSWSSS